MSEIPDVNVMADESVDVNQIVDDYEEKLNDQRMYYEKKLSEERLHYLEQLSENYPTISKASSEIINLQAILYLPKGTEHFISDIHGEYDAFSQTLKNGSGAVRKKIREVFGHTLSDKEKNELATLIYYPKKKIDFVKKKIEDPEELSNWYRVTLYRLIEVCKTASSKYTRSKVRKALPKDYAYIIEELITEKPEVLNKQTYYEAIVNSVVDLEQADEFIVVLCELIQQLVIDHLHVLGDIYDRGSGPHLIMDRLSKYHSFDIQWGNHDIIWMGAAAGQLTCIATVIRNSIRYGNLDVLEEGYGINMLPLATFAMKAYENDPCTRFTYKIPIEDPNNLETEMIRKMHKAIAIIRFKLEGQTIMRWPSYHMEDRLLLNYIDYEAGTIVIDGQTYPLLDTNFPTIDPKDPYKLSEGEEAVIQRFRSYFVHCDKLQAHVKLLLKNGSMYKIYNQNLLYHGCVPLNEDGTFRKVDIYGKKYKGKELFDILENYVRKAFFSTNKREKQKGMDIMWYIWASKDSPLFGRAKMATFERYFVDDEELKLEPKNCYYSMNNDPELVDRILDAFGIEGDRRHIINGHVPVHRRRGEKPVKAGGKLILIDGGYSKAYRNRTQIAGYTLVFNSYGLTLTAHEPFESSEDIVKFDIDMVSRQEAVQNIGYRLLVGDTDQGHKMKKRIDDLNSLIECYREGTIVEKNAKKSKESYTLY